MFTPSEHGELWKCPFCDPSETVYKLSVPPAKETERLYHIKRLIREHVELHQKDLLSKMDSKDYDKVSAFLLKTFFRVHMLTPFLHLVKGREHQTSEIVDYRNNCRSQIIRGKSASIKSIYTHCLFLIRRAQSCS